MKIAIFAMAAMMAAIPLVPALAEDAAGGASTVAPSAKFTLDTPIQTLVADAQAKAVLDKFLPGTTTHPSYGMFKGMSLRQVQPYSGGAITDQALADVERELAAIQ